MTFRKDSKAKRGNFSTENRSSHQACFMKNGVYTYKFHKIYRKTSVPEHFLLKKKCISCVFFELSKNTQKQSPEVFFEKSCRPATLLKKRPWHRCFSVKFVKFLRTPLLQNTSGRLLLREDIVLIIL